MSLRAQRFHFEGFHYEEIFMLMYKKLVFGIFLAIISFSFTGCEELLDNCKVCSLNTYEDGVLINSSSETEYCGSKLVTILATKDIVDGGLVTKWECR